MVILLHYCFLTTDNTKKQSYCQDGELTMAGGSITHYQSWKTMESIGKDGFGEQ